MKSKKILLTIGMLLILLGVNFISAEFWSCFQKEDVVHYCSGYKPDWTCELNNGCEKCMSIYRGAEDCYVHGVWGICMKIPQDCSIGNNGTNGTIDSEPPIINISSPVNGEKYNTDKVYVSGGANEIADWYYMDNLDGRDLWIKICEKVTICNKKVNFGEGDNDVSVKAIDRVGNEVTKDFTFFVDSRKPRIYKIAPKGGFVDGNFEIQFKEENPASLILHYGNKTESVNLGNCHEEKSKIYCDSSIDLKEFDGREINYWYTLTDIAGNFAESKSIKIKVDTTAPVINNMGSFWTQNGKYIYFNISITEKNFDEAGYSYVDSHGIVREKKLCSALKNGMCTVKKTFSTGHYDLTVNVLDDAGNSIGVPISFDVN